MSTSFVRRALALATTSILALGAVAAAPAAMTAHGWGSHLPQTFGTFDVPGFGELVRGPDGAIYTSDCGNARIYRFDQRGHGSVFAGAGDGGFDNGYSGDGGPALLAHFGCPMGMVVDRTGALLVADHLNDVIRRIDRRGIVSTIAGVGPLYEGYDPGWTDGVGPAAGDGGPALKAGFDAPWGIELDLAGNLYIADRDHDAIRKVDTHGIISTLAGTGVRGYSGDGGQATSAMLDRPLDVAPAWGGVRYIADENNARIRRVDAFGRITTIGGTGELGCTGDGGPATAAPIQNPNSLDLGWDGTLYFSEAECNIVRAIRPDGTHRPDRRHRRGRLRAGGRASRARHAAERTLRAGGRPGWAAARQHRLQRHRQDRPSRGHARRRRRVDDRRRPMTGDAGLGRAAVCRVVMALLATVSIVAGCASTPTSSPSVAASSLSSSSTVPPPVSASSAAVSPPAGAAPSLATSDIFGGGMGTVFASPHFGYAVSVPGDWLVTPASASWRSTGLRYGSPSLDVAGGGGVRFTGTSQPLRAQTPDTWVRAYAAALGLSACVGATDDTFTIEALPATTILGGCADPSGQTGIGHGRRYDVVVTAGGRGYDFRLDGDVDVGMVRRSLTRSTFVRPMRPPSIGSTWARAAISRSCVPACRAWTSTSSRSSGVAARPTVS